jgi:predicted MFS family arabinose efflux permease
MSSSGMLPRVALVFLRSVLRLLLTANVVPSSPSHVTLTTEEILSSELSVLKEPHIVTSQKATFFIVTAVKTSDLT